MNGMPLQVVARNVGHASTAITERHYAHLAPNYISEEIQRTAPTFGLTPGKVVPMKRKKDGD